MQQQAIDQATGAAAGSISAAGAIVAAQDVALAFFGVPLFVVLAGFAGVFYGITLRESMKPAALWANVVVAVFLGVAGGGGLASWLGLPPIGMAGLSAAAGFALTAGQPWLKKNLNGVLDGIRDKLLRAPRRNGDGHE